MNWTKIVFYLLIWALAFLGVVFYRWVFSYVLYALILAYLLDPFVNWFDRLHFPRWLSVLAVYAVIAGVMAWLSIQFMPDFLEQGNNLLTSINSGSTDATKHLMAQPFVRNIHTMLLNLDRQIPNLDMSGQFIGILSSTNEYLARLPKLLMDNYQSIISMVSFIATIPLISFFLLKDKVAIRKAMIAMTPNRYFELVIILMHKIDQTVGRFLRAMLFEVIIVAIMVTIALTIVGVRNSVLIGVIAGIANIVPYFGPLIGAAVAILTVLLDGSPTIMILWAALAMYAVQALDNNIIYPVVVGKTINMHPLLVLLTVLAGGWFGGILWMLISVPLVYIAFSLVRVLYTNMKEFRLI